MEQNKRYSLELTEQQLYLIAACVEDVCRFMCGQTDLSNSTAVLDDFDDVRDVLRDCYRYVVPELFEKYGGHASYGWNGGRCPNEAQRKFIAQTYYLYREIYHQLELNRENPHDWNVYQSETLTCADSGEPIKITKL
jgi:hypothetical protein